MGNTSSQLVPHDQSQETDQIPPTAQVRTSILSSLSPFKTRQHDRLQAEDGTGALENLTPPATHEDSLVDAPVTGTIDITPRAHESLEDDSASEYHEASSRLATPSPLPVTPRAHVNRTPRSQRLSPVVLISRPQSLDTHSTPVRSPVERPTLLPPFETGMAILSKDLTKEEREKKLARKALRAEKRARKESRNLQRALNTSDGASASADEAGAANGAHTPEPRPIARAPSPGTPSPATTQAPTVQQTRSPEKQKKPKQSSQNGPELSTSQPPANSQSPKKRARSDDQDASSQPQKKKGKKQPVDDAAYMRSSPPVAPGAGFTAINTATQRLSPPPTMSAEVTASPKKSKKSASAVDVPQTQQDVSPVRVEEQPPISADTAGAPSSQLSKKEKKRQMRAEQDAAEQLQSELFATQSSQPPPSPKKKTKKQKPQPEVIEEAREATPPSVETQEAELVSQVVAASPKKKSKKKKQPSEEDANGQAAEADLATDSHPVLLEQETAESVIDPQLLPSSPKKKRKHVQNEAADDAPAVTTAEEPALLDDSSSQPKKKSKKTKQPTDGPAAEEPVSTENTRTTSKKKSKKAATPEAEDEVIPATAASAAEEPFMSEMQKWEAERNASRKAQLDALQSKIAGKSSKSRKSSGGRASTTPRTSLASRGSSAVVTGPFTDEERDTVKTTINDYCREYNVEFNDVKMYFSDKTPGSEHNNDRKRVYDLLTEALPQRERKSIRQFLHRYLSNAHRGKWTDEEDAELKNLYEQKPAAWTWIAARLERLPEDCRDRWRDFSGLQGRATGEWKPDEVTALENAVATVLENMRNAGEEGTDAELLEKINWGTVSNLVGGKRSRLQCRYKWIGKKRSLDRTDESGRVKETRGRKKAPNFTSAERITDSDEEAQDPIEDVPTDAEPMSSQEEVPETEDEADKPGANDASSSIVESSPSRASPELGGVWSSASKPKVVYGKKRR